MGAPTLWGTFVGGDDHRLVLNHVLVNHPSFEHAIELFAIIHRDLYQPLPLLSFSAEFAVADFFDLFRDGVDSGAWLFHLTNILLHAFNALLVWAVVRKLCTASLGKGAGTVAMVAGVLFAAHPLQVEVVAWINGRMMLLSTLFALLAVLALAEWLDSRKTSWALAAPFFSLCCAISKIRVGLPLLLLLAPLAMKRKLSRSFWLIWSTCVVITVIFGAVNYYATSQAGMFSGAAEHLQGSRIARSVISLAWYLEHFVWPVGLASWYPAPGFVRWSDAETLRAIAIVLPVVGLFMWAVFRSRLTAMGFAWFFATIASTLQLVPTRNTLAADRYMYLPIVGLVWVCAVFFHKMRRADDTQEIGKGRRSIEVALGAIVVALLVGVSWHVAGYYERPVRKSERIVELFPDAMHVWERLGWAYYNVERYEESIVAAEHELVHADKDVRSEAYQLIGAANIKLGHFDAAIEALDEAIELDPESPNAVYRMAAAHFDMGQIDKAIPFLEQAVARAPLKNPWIIRLAGHYRRLDQRDSALAMYEQALRNNEYEVPAILGLVELDIETGTHESYQTGEMRLGELLDWMPENTAARVALGVIMQATKRVEQAVRVYGDIVNEDPNNTSAAVNLARIYESAGEIGQAGKLYQHAIQAGLETIDQAKAAHRFWVTQGLPKKAVAMWSGFARDWPGFDESRAFNAIALALSEETSAARRIIVEQGKASPDSALILVAMFIADMNDGQTGPASRRIDSICERETGSVEAMDQLRLALGYMLRRNSDEPRTYCLAAQLWACEGQRQNAESFLGLCEERCRDDDCAALVAQLRERFQNEQRP